MRRGRGMQKFRPVTTELPKALLPLVNSPMLEYPLEWLAMSGVAKVHLFCCAHADTIRRYIESSIKWAPGKCDMEINIVTSYNCRSVGEALRLIDHEGLIQDDFILLSCDCVTNMNLRAALQVRVLQRRLKSSHVHAVSECSEAQRPAGAPRAPRRRQSVHHVNRCSRRRRRGAESAAGDV